MQSLLVIPFSIRQGGLTYVNHKTVVWRLNRPCHDPLNTVNRRAYGCHSWYPVCPWDSLLSCLSEPPGVPRCLSDIPQAVQRVHCMPLSVRDRENLNRCLLTPPRLRHLLFIKSASPSSELCGSCFLVYTIAHFLWLVNSFFQLFWRFYI